LKVLKESGFNGVLSYETEGFVDKDEAFKMVVESRKFLINALENT
jgi:sugar phosphate isomerase/epimerase